MAVTREICDKGALEIQHAECKAGRLDVADKHQTECQPMSKVQRDKVEMRKIPYASTVKSLMYIVVCTRTGIAYVFGTVSHFISNPGKELWAVVKWVLKYLKGTSSLCLNPILEGFTNFDMSVDAYTS